MKNFLSPLSASQTLFFLLVRPSGWRTTVTDIPNSYYEATVNRQNSWLPFPPIMRRVSLYVLISTAFPREWDSLFRQMICFVPVYFRWCLRKWAYILQQPFAFIYGESHP